MSVKLALFASIAAATGLFVSAQAELDPALAPDFAPACGIDRADNADGFVLTAWNELSSASSWSLLVTQSTGGGGFDISQSGDVEFLETGDPVLSEMEIYAGYSVSARLTVWDADGLAVCSDRLEV
ncbi:curli-like amyloid fiber formation chaperone CsgH [Maricaulis parjimensis]|uniref:curli-like amyloid fiber formation chaperone CsgH n=1 Tax=Maricaulis parjimensis TaxID=144023 RepID=UPI0019396758|nr:curli-like amyloid fiber formation chaperone CsgH [Maricaulis parjimensis]